MAEHRHRRATQARRAPGAVVVAAPLAVLATVGAVGLGVLTAEPQAPDELLADAPASPLRPSTGGASGGPSSEALVSDRKARLSRGNVGRGASQVVDGVDMSAVATDEAVDEADDRLWTTAPLNVWTLPGPLATDEGEIPDGEKVLVTGRRALGRAEVVVDGQARWVTDDYLSTEKPFTLGGACTNGTTVPASVSENIKAVHEAVCAEFPDISTYGTLRSDGEHAQGIAIDIMVSGDEGLAVRNFVQQYYAELGVSYIIYQQQIWSVQRSGEGWRPMSDRGSITANHYDHVHVTTYP